MSSLILFICIPGTICIINSVRVYFGFHPLSSCTSLQFENIIPFIKKSCSFITHCGQGVQPKESLIMTQHSSIEYEAPPHMENTVLENVRIEEF
jgi:hypothetical protein